MLYHPHDIQPYRILAIDPGTNTLGTAIIEVDLRNLAARVTYADTHRGDMMAREYEEAMYVHGERTAKLMAHENNLHAMMRHWGVHRVVSESPYMGRFAAAFASGVECLFMIRNAIQRYSPHIALETVDPATVKKTVGVSGKSGDKELMAKALWNLRDPSFVFNVDLNFLDEHAVDACAVGYWLTRQIRELATPQG